MGTDVLGRHTWNFLDDGNARCPERVWISAEHCQMVYLKSKHFVGVNFIRGKKQNISKVWAPMSSMLEFGVKHLECRTSKRLPRRQLYR